MLLAHIGTAHNAQRSAGAPPDGAHVLRAARGAAERAAAAREERRLKQLEEAKSAAMELAQCGLCERGSWRDGDPIVRPFEIGIRCWELGVYVRWGGDTLQFAPPFISEESDIRSMSDTLAEAIDQVH